jgi:hypothetical protein
VKIYVIGNKKEGRKIFPLSLKISRYVMLCGKDNLLYTPPGRVLFGLALYGSYTRTSNPTGRVA